MTNSKPAGRKNRSNRKGGNRHHERHSRPVVQPSVVPQLQSPDVFPPLVSTTAPKPAPIDIKYSKEEICNIVKGITDLSCPAVASEDVKEVVGDGDVNKMKMVETANQDLVSKGRTMSIDQAIQHGVPRSLSVDSVDYTNMLRGEMDQETTEKIRRTRKQNKHQPKL